jgi:hypothetical protein
MLTLADGDDPGVCDEPGETMRIVEQAFTGCGWQAVLRGPGIPATWTVCCAEMGT